ncbi:MAG: flagellar biosynthetic protein FliO [Thermodesulfobacteriota bacterium]
MTITLAVALLLPLATAGAAETLAGGEPVSLAAAIVKVAVSLAVVIALLVAVVALLRKSGVGQGVVKAGRLINVLETRMIAPKKYVAVVEIGGETLALGITDQQITRLAALPAVERSVPVSSERQSPFAAVLRRAADGIAPERKGEGSA